MTNVCVTLTICSFVYTINMLPTAVKCMCKRLNFNEKCMPKKEIKSIFSFFVVVELTRFLGYGSFIESPSIDWLPDKKSCTLLNPLVGGGNINVYVFQEYLYECERNDLGQNSN